MRNTPAHAPPSLIQCGVRLLLTALVLLVTTANAQADVILHAFNWPYATVEARAKQIADAGYRKVLVAPRTAPKEVPGGRAINPRTSA